MTILGCLFAAAYLLSMLHGRRGVLWVMAVAVPFFDSAAISASGVTISPYYLGCLLFVVLTTMSGRPRVPRGVEWLPVSLAVWGALGAAAAPLLFAGTPVVVSSINVDDQAGNLSALAPTSSNLAQASYLLLNVAVLLLSNRARLLEGRMFTVGLGVGTVVAVAADIAGLVGVTWPSSFFDNSGRNFYSTFDPRLRAQFSEPSHLGAFALVALLYFLVRTYRAREPLQFVISFALLVMATVCFAGAASGTGIVGGFLAITVVLATWIVRGLRRGLSRRQISLRSAACLTLLALTATAASLPASAAVRALVSTKSGSQSQVTRAFIDQNGWTVFFSTAGIGVGLGSNRTSSLAMLLASTVGLPGCALMIGLVLVVLCRALRCGEVSDATALVAFICAAVISFADFASPLLWLPMAICWGASRGGDRDASASLAASTSAGAPSPAVALPIR